MAAFKDWLGTIATLLVVGAGVVAILSWAWKRVKLFVRGEVMPSVENLATQIHALNQIVEPLAKAVRHGARAQEQIKMNLVEVRARLRMEPYSDDYPGLPNDDG